MSRGCLIGRRLRYVIGEPVADTATLTALPADDQRHMDGCICVTLSTSAIWVYDTTSTAPAGPTVLLSTNGPGRWLLSGGGATGADSAGAVNPVSVRGASTANIANLASFTVAGVDGLTYVEGERILLKDQTSQPENGLYRCGAVATGTCALTRVGEADASAEITAGMLVWVSEGTAAGNEWYYLTTDDPIVLGTTNLVFAQLPSAVDFASLETRVSNDECDLSDAESSLASVETRLSEDECDLSDAESSLASVETRLSEDECDLSDAESSLASVETRLSEDECDLSDAESSLASVETRLSNEECARSDTDSSVDSIETRLSNEECARSDTDSSLASVETRLSGDECDLSDAESSLDSIQTRLSNSESSVGSIETRLSNEECARSDTDSSLASVETRLSGDECDLSDAESSLDSIQTRLSNEECARSDTDSSLASVETRLSGDECDLSDAESSMASIETRLSGDECDLSDAESSLASVETRISNEECTRSTADSSLDARLDVHLTKSICFFLQEFREVDANGDVGNLAAHGGILASDSTPALQGGTNEDTEISWAVGNTDIISTNCSLPVDLDAGSDITGRMWVSSGAGGPDAATFTINSSFDQAAQVSDTATDGAAGAARHEITFTIANADIPAGADTLTMQLVPAAHANDPIQLHGIRLEYSSTAG